MEVIWKFDGIFKANAQKVYEEIGERRVTPEEVLEQARNNVDSELHKCFEWDDSVAAEKFRLQQARQIIQLLVITPKYEDDEPIRAFQISSEKNVYQPTRLIIQQPDEYTQLLKRAKGELFAIEKRYKMLSELEAVFAAIDML